MNTTAKSEATKMATKVDLIKLKVDVQAETDRLSGNHKDLEYRVEKAENTANYARKNKDRLKGRSLLFVFTVCAILGGLLTRYLAMSDGWEGYMMLTAWTVGGGVVSGIVSLIWIAVFFSND